MGLQCRKYGQHLNRCQVCNDWSKNYFMWIEASIYIKLVILKVMFIFGWSSACLYQEHLHFWISAVSTFILLSIVWLRPLDTRSWWKIKIICWCAWKICCLLWSHGHYSYYSIWSPWPIAWSLTILSGQSNQRKSILLLFPPAHLAMFQKISNSDTGEEVNDDLPHSGSPKIYECLYGQVAAMRDLWAQAVNLLQRCTHLQLKPHHRGK